MRAIRVEARTEIRAELGEVRVHLFVQDSLDRQGANSGRVRDVGVARQSEDFGGGRGMATFAGRSGNLANEACAIGIEPVQ